MSVKMSMFALQYYIHTYIVCSVHLVGMIIQYCKAIAVMVMLISYSVRYSSLTLIYTEHSSIM